MLVPPHAAPSLDPADLDDAIPLLTEIVEMPAEALPVAAPTLAELSASPTEADWAGLEQRLHDQVLERIAARAQEFFDQGLDLRVDALLEQAAVRLRQELRQAFSELAQSALKQAADKALAEARAAADETPPSI